jgi:hypothetical protein
MSRSATITAQTFVDCAKALVAWYRLTGQAIAPFSACQQHVVVLVNARRVAMAKESER